MTVKTNEAAKVKESVKAAAKSATKTVKEAAGKMAAKAATIIEVKPAKRRIAFEIDAGPGKTVGVAGTFNDWNPEAKLLKDKNGDGIYRGFIILEPGHYEYKFVVDGIWSMDAKNPLFAPNDFGTLNSLIIVD